MKLTSASKQELDIAFFYNPNYEVDKIKNLKAAVTHLADHGCANHLIIGDYNYSMGMLKIHIMHPKSFSLDSRKTTSLLTSTDIFIALVNQNLISGVTGMKHTWNQSKYYDHAMVTVVVN